MEVGWLFFYGLDVIGTISFALSGAMVAVKKNMDLLGVLVLGNLTAVGGGVLRDVLLGSVPPKAFVDSRFVVLASLASLLLFVLAKRFKEQYIARENLVDAVNNLFDAMGLGAFSVTGVQVAQEAGHGENMFFCVFLGVMTGVGGGLMRDIVVDQIPAVLTKHIYAVASMMGAISYYLLLELGCARAPSSVAGIFLVFLIRVLATRYRWNLPYALT